MIINTGGSLGPASGFGYAEIDGGDKIIIQNFNASGDGHLNLETQSLSSSGNITVTVNDVFTDGLIEIREIDGHDFVLDASSFGGTIDTHSIDLTGSAVFVLGERGDFSADIVETNSSFTLDASNALTGQISIRTLSASDVTVAMGSGSGHLTLATGYHVYDSLNANGNVVIDAPNFGGSIDAKAITASGSVTVSLEESGDFSAGQVSTNSNFILDASNSHTGSVNINDVSGSNVAISMGGGSGHLIIGKLVGLVVAFRLTGMSRLMHRALEEQSIRNESLQVVQSLFL